MRLRSVFVSMATVVGLAAATIAPATSASAEPQAGPTIYQVQVQNLKPSQLQQNGGRPVVVQGKSYQSVCWFDVYRYNGYTGDEYLDTVYSGSLRYVDYLAGYQNGYYTYYYMRAYSCSGVGGSYAYSNVFYPYVNDDDSVTVYGGGTRVYTSGAYGGSYRKQTAIGRSLHIYAPRNDYNVAVYAQTGPSGGVATVYYDGVRKGTVSFYSGSVKNRQLVWAAGAQTPGYHDIRFVISGRGPGGGTTITFDALGEFAS